MEYPVPRGVVELQCGFHPWQTRAAWVRDQAASPLPCCSPISPLLWAHSDLEVAMPEMPPRMLLFRLPLLQNLE